MQDIRKALMGHSSGEDVNAIYTHVELPAKREAIRKLEAWVATHNPQPEMKGTRDERSTTTNSGTSSDAECRPDGTETVEEADADPGRARSN